METQDSQVRTDIAKENIKDTIDDISSSLSSDKPLTQEELVDVMKRLINDLQVEVYTLENSDPE